MELKEIEEQVLRAVIDNYQQKVAPIGKITDAVMAILKTYGQSQYNAAIDKAAENAKVKTERFGGVGGVKIKVFNIVDKDSILTLKIPTK